MSHKTKAADNILDPSEYLKCLVVAHFMCVSRPFVILFRRKKVCSHWHGWKSFKDTMWNPFLLLLYASEAYFLLIKSVVKYLLILFFSPLMTAAGKSTDIDLISEMPCPKASNQHKTVSLNSPRNSPVLGLDVRNGSRKWRAQKKTHTVFQAHQGFIFQPKSLIRWPGNFSWGFAVSFTKWPFN